MTISNRSAQAGGFNRRRAYELVGVALDIASHTATDGDERAVGVCVMMPDPGPGFPVASGIQDEADLATIRTAANKASTVLVWGRNTANLADYGTIDVLAAQASHSFFCPWDGGIQVYDQSGTLLCALAASGRSALGDRILVVKAAHQMGYRTDFNEDGLTESEAKAIAERG
ncbi:MAG TPA: heme-binding protein [Candidatus Saccharimonadales bacterium]|nr:heme-binding protein [Candidatus Saccharimonadales bacterium]